MNIVPFAPRRSAHASMPATLSDIYECNACGSAGPTVYECIACRAVEVLCCSHPDCCSVCGSSLTIVEPPSARDGLISTLEDLGYEIAPGAQKEWSDWREKLDDAELRIAAAAILLAAMPDDTTRFTWIEHELFTLNDFPPPDQPADPYRTAIMRWWLEIFEKQNVR